MTLTRIILVSLLHAVTPFFIPGQVCPVRHCHSTLDSNPLSLGSINKKRNSLEWKLSFIPNQYTSEAPDPASIETQIPPKHGTIKITTPPPQSPSNDNPHSKYEEEFHSMISDFALYTPHEIESLDGPQYQAVFRGIAEAYRVPAVLRAFSVLYQDVTPLRIPGRFLFGHLKGVMEKSLTKRREERMSILSRTGLEVEDVNVGRRAWCAIRGDDHHVSVERLRDSGFLEAAVEVLGHSSLDDLTRQMTGGRKRRIDFETFLIGFHGCAAPDIPISPALMEIMDRVESLPKETSKKTKRNQKHSDRYDHMLYSFSRWENRIPSGEGRMLDVLRGCFAGGENEKIVEALRVVYVDFATLRFAGDLIFKLMSNLIENEKR